MRVDERKIGEIYVEAWRWVRFAFLAPPVAVVAVVVDGRTSAGGTVPLARDEWTCPNYGSVESTGIRMVGRIPLVQSREAAECTGYVRELTPKR